MSERPPPVMTKVHALVDRYRAQCLWFLRRDYYPASIDEARQALDYIQRYGDLEAFRQAGQLKRWLSPSSSGGSAG